MKIKEANDLIEDAIKTVLNDSRWGKRHKIILELVSDRVFEKGYRNAGNWIGQVYGYHPVAKALHDIADATEKPAPKELPETQLDLFTHSKERGDNEQKI